MSRNGEPSYSSRHRARAARPIHTEIPFQTVARTSCVRIRASQEPNAVAKLDNLGRTDVRHDAALDEAHGVEQRRMLPRSWNACERWWPESYLGQTCRGHCGRFSRAHGLEPAGYHVLAARDRLEALRKIRYFVPDLVLLDLLMGGMDGFSVCEILRDLSSCG